LAAPLPAAIKNNTNATRLPVRALMLRQQFCAASKLGSQSPAVRHTHPKTPSQGCCYARSLRIEKKNMLRIVERPRLKARKKRLTEQQLSLRRKHVCVDVFDDLVADL